MKKTLAILLCILIALPAMALPHNFRYYYEQYGLLYSVIDENAKTCKVKNSDYSGMTSVVIPEIAYDTNDYGEEVGYRVISIESEAFMDVNSLTSIIIPASVVVVGDRAFSNCRNLKKAAYPNTIPDPFISTGHLSSVGCAYDPLGSIYENGFIYGPEKKSILYAPWNLKGNSNGNYSISNNTTEIGCRAFYHCSILKSITIPMSVTSIGGAAFYGCSSLETVSIPNSVTSIGISAFGDCGSLKSVSIPNSVTSIEESTFIACSGLTSVTFPESVISIGDNAFQACNVLETVEFPNSLISIGCEAFKYCELLRSVTIPNSVTTIGQGAFSECTALKSVTIPSSVTSIENSVFSNCENLTSVTIPESVTSIGDRAFSYCRMLPSITIPKAVTTIGERAFEYCRSFVSVIIPGSVTSVGNYAFSNCDGLKKSAYPNTINNPFSKGYAVMYDPQNDIFEDDWIFGPYKKSIVSVPWYIEGEYAIDNTVSEIGAGAFAGCASLTSVTIPETVASIGAYAFAGCSSLTSMSIPDSVSSIGEGIFSQCINFISVKLPKAMATIGDYIFAGCKNLASVEIPESITSIGDYAFKSCDSLTSITIPKTVTSIGKGAFSACSGLTSVIIPNSVTIVKENTFENCTSLTSIAIPEYVTAIEDGAFWNCEALTTVAIPNSVTHIGNNAFASCEALTSVKIPNSLWTIGAYAFSHCSALTSVTIPTSTYYVGKGAFNKCTALTKVIIPSVNTIEPETFYGDKNLGTVFIGKSVYRIAESAFFDCADPIEVYIGGETGASKDIFNCSQGTLYVTNELVAERYRKSNPWRNFMVDTMKVPNRLKIDGESRLLVKPGDKIQLSASFDTEDISMPYIFWSSSNSKIATVDENGLVTVNALLDGEIPLATSAADDASPSECKIFAESLYSGGLISNASVTLSCISTPTGIDNKTNDFIDSNEGESNTTIEVFNIQGIKVADSIDNLTGGIYIVRHGNNVKKLAVK